MSYKTISFRLNMDDLEEANLYQMIMDESDSYTSLSSFMRIVLKEHFDNSRQGQINEELKEFIRKQFEQLENKLIAGTVNVSNRQLNGLPEECSSLPEQLTSVLNMFD